MINTDEILKLINEKQYAQVKREIVEQNEADIADLLEDIHEDEQRIRVFRLLPKDVAADVFSHLPIELEQSMITSLTEKETNIIIENMFADDAADLMEEMPANVVKRILANASAETRRDINHLLKYEEDSAGSIMTVEFVDLKRNMTVKQAIARIREVGIDKETINTCYVLDLDRKILGTVTLRTLLLSNPDAVVADIMEERVISVTTTDDQETVAHQFQKYDFLAMPVVDSENRLVGIITVDDIVDILQEEATEDIEKMAAILPSEKPYLRTGVWETYKSRIPWLLFLMISATFTGMILSSYEKALAIVPALTAFIPMLMDTGGNAGSQASVSVIRALSLKDVEFKDIGKVVVKEALVAVCIGTTLAVANLIRLIIMYGYDEKQLMVTFTVCVTLALVVVIAKVIGCTLPILANQLGFDPAVMASPLITTLVDAVSLSIYFAIASKVFKF